MSEEGKRAGIRDCPGYSTPKSLQFQQPDTME